MRTRALRILYILSLVLGVGFLSGAPRVSEGSLSGKATVAGTRTAIPGALVTATGAAWA